MSQIDLEKAKFVLQERDNSTGQWGPVKGWTDIEGKTKAHEKIEQIKQEAISRGEHTRHFRVRAKIETNAYNEGWKDAIAWLRNEVEQYDDVEVPSAKPRKAG